MGFVRIERKTKKNKNKFHFFIFSPFLWFLFFLLFYENRFNFVNVCSFSSLFDTSECFFQSNVSFCLFWSFSFFILASHLVRTQKRHAKTLYQINSILLIFETIFLFVVVHIWFLSSFFVSLMTIWTFKIINSYE